VVPRLRILAGQRQIAKSSQPRRGALIAAIGLDDTLDFPQAPGH